MGVLLRGDIPKEVLDLLVFDAKALGEILHGGFERSVAAAQLLLHENRILGMGLLRGDGLQLLGFVFKHVFVSLKVFLSIFAVAWKLSRLLSRFFEGESGLRAWGSRGRRGFAAA